LNADGSFQPQCKRGMPTPAASFAYFTKISRFFPQDKTMGQYLLTYLPEDQANEVTAISGCCLMARREVWDAIGPLDENIFSYGEDIDWCVRASKANWQVWYYPASQIVPLKGKGGAHSKPYKKAWGMHNGMWVFYRKHLMHKYSPITSAFVGMGIGLGFATTCARVAVSRIKN
jgi:GT2 family glycosyltransferase